MEKRGWVAVIVLCALPALAWGQEPAGEVDAPGRSIGVHAALGTDVTLGLGFGAGVTVWIPRPGQSFDFEIGGQFFYANVEETTDEAINSYTETTTLAVLAVRANLLWDYDPENGGVYYVLGSGAAGVSMSWEERSATDTSLGTPLPGGGSKQEDDGVRGAIVANAGIGLAFAGGFDLRAELPLLVFLGTVGEVAAVAPTITVSAGMRF